MKSKTYKTESDWLAARRGVVTGTRAGELCDTKGALKAGAYELLAESVGAMDDPQFTTQSMERGHLLEPIAIDKLSKLLDREIESGYILWTTDDGALGSSPDGVLSKTEACEVKCFSNGKHFKAYLEREVPKEYRAQALQYFVVNPDLQTLYFTFYSDRFPEPYNLFYLTLKRDALAEEIAEQEAMERSVLARLTIEPKS